MFDNLIAGIFSGDVPVKCPNIPFPTAGGKVFWNVLDENNGWKLQQNSVTGHCRILDPDDIRRDFGNLAAMERVFRKISECGQGGE